MGRKNSYMIFYAVIMLAVVSVLGMVYASLSQTLKVQGDAVIKNNSSWNIHFDTTSSTVTPVKGSGTYGTATDANLTLTTIDGIQVDLKAPGDEFTYNFTIINDGKINATLGSILNVSDGIITKTCTGTDASSFCDKISVKLYKNKTGTTLASIGMP